MLGQKKDKKKKKNIWKKKTFPTLFIDRLGDVTLLTLVHAENILLDAA